MLVTIVIPTFNEEKNVERLLRSIKSQSHKKIETVVVDDGSTDNTVTLAKKYAKVFKRKHAERSVQRNFGALRAKGKFLLFLDADMELSKNVVKECVQKALETKAAAIIIPEKSVAKNFWEKVKAYERSFYNKSGDPSTDAARFFDRSVFKKVGGYDERITGPEDWDLPDTVRKKGYKIERIKSVILHHERVKSLFSLVKKKYYYALSSDKYLEKQNIPVVSPKTIYFLRPVFYKNWKTIAKNPFISGAMIFMLTAELFGGVLGFIVGFLGKK